MAGNLIHRATHEAENPLEASLRASFNLHQQNLQPPFHLKPLTEQQYSSLNDAVLFAILLQPNLSKTHLKHLHAIVNDGYEHFTSMLIRIVDELYVKLTDSVKIQLILVTRELIDVLAVGFDSLLVALLRQILGGDFSEGNLWLCSEMIGVFVSKFDCFVEEEPLVLSYGLYVFLRVLADHSRRVSSDSRLDVLRRLEIEFCVRVLRERFDLCLKVGRDLVRLLQDLVHVVEFKSVWKDLLLNPGRFKVDCFDCISRIYCIRTPSLYFSLRITPDMERKLRFLLTSVKLGNQRRYQVWFAKKFVFSPERETLLVDMVRFICCACHPLKEGLQSDILPRWAVIGWLLKCCQKSYVQANFKLALFYDWLFFDEKVDDVMSIEPAISLMVNSIPKYIDVTNTLLEFLLILVDNYDVERKDMIINGVLNAIRVLLVKGVISSLDVLIQCDMLSPLLREMLKKLLSVTQITHSEELKTTNLPQIVVPPSICHLR